MTAFCIGFFLGLGLGFVLARSEKRRADRAGLAEGAALNPFKDDLLFASGKETPAGNRTQNQFHSPGEESMRM